jgi:hypothetical protein
MSKKAVKKTAKKKTAAKKAAAATATPRREDIQGIALDLPDLSNWKLATKVLKIKPFYQKPGALPFSCFQATQMHMDPPKKVNGVTYNSVNDFRLAEQCLQHAKTALLLMTMGVGRAGSGRTGRADRSPRRCAAALWALM